MLMNRELEKLNTWLTAIKLMVFDHGNWGNTKHFSLDFNNVLIERVKCTQFLVSTKIKLN